MVKNLTENNAPDVLANTPGVILVDFYAEWCGPCRMLAPTIEALAEANDGKINVFKVDTDNNIELARNYNVQTIPTLIFFKDGREIERINGAVPQHQLQQVIDSLL
ncbi:MAG: thioredoxin [Bacteroidales bacterium]|nr:thioredoxin [Bacteroidales bacterium]